MTRRDRETNSRSTRLAQPTGAGGPSRRWPAGVAVVGAIAVGAWFWLGRDEDLVDRTLDMERRLLVDGAAGRPGKRAVDEIIRNVDRMDSAALKRVQQTLEAEWQRARAADVEAYFAAQAEDRQSILDRSIDRSLVYKELRFAVNPRAWSRDGRRPKKPRTPPKESAAAGAATAAEKAAQRQLLERYDEALRQRARERRIDLPAWQ